MNPFAVLARMAWAYLHWWARWDAPEWDPKAWVARVGRLYAERGD